MLSIRVTGGACLASTGVWASLEEAMSALADGERGAFDPVYEALRPKVEAFCRAYLEKEDARDATQEVLVRIFAQASNFRRGASVEAWALTIARWECCTWRRRRKRAKEVPWDDVAPMRGGALEEEMETRLVTEAVLRAVSCLGPADQEVILKSVLDSEPLGPTMRKRKQRALDRLRAIWRRFYGDR